MPPRVPVHWVGRAEVSEALSSREPVVLLLGPRGSGKSSALAAWAADRTDVDWVVDGVVPERTAGCLLVDDGDRCSTETWAALRRLVERNPAVFLRIAARSRHALPDGWEMVECTSLYLDLGGIAALLESTGSPADPGVVELITCGHPASVRLVAQSRATTPRAMAEAVASVQHGTDGEADARLAVPMHLTADLVAELGGAPDALEKAEREGIGRWTGSPDVRVFQLVPGVRHSARARRVVDRAARLQIRAIAAASLLRHGAYLESLVEAVAAQRLDLAERAIMAGGLTLLTRYSRQVEALLRGVPMHRLVSHPVVAGALGLVIHDQGTRSATSLETARIAAAGFIGMSATALSQTRPGLRALLKALEGAAMRVVHIGDGGVEASRKAAAVLDGLPLIDQDELGAMKGLAHANIALTLMVADHLDEARRQAMLGLDARRSSAEELLAIGVLATADALAGRMADARTTLAQAGARSWPSQTLASHAGDLSRIARAWEAVERADVTAAGAVIDDLWRTIDTTEHWPMIAHVRAVLDVVTGDAVAGLERFRAVRHVRTDPRFARTPAARLVEVAESLLLLATGRSEQAMSALRDHPDHPQLVLATARVCLVRGDDGRALELLRSCTPVHPADVMTSEALRAVLLSRAGRDEDAHQALTRARGIGAVQGLRTPLLFLPADPGELGETTGWAGLLPAQSATPVLTARERVVLLELYRGGTVSEIAAKLHVSVNTVKSQRQQIYRKLGVSTREDALLRAFALNLLEA